jgi:tripartite-type tricarboxylate transporter receptor subunit TctC
MAPGVTAEQQAFFVELMKKVRATPEWKDYMEKGAFNQSFMVGADYVKWVDAAEKNHRQLMTEAGFLAK